MFDMFMTAFSSACSLEALVANFIGVALGIVFGALPASPPSWAWPCSFP